MDEKTKVVDVILPNFNGEKSLRETISSIINQTFKNFNLYIIDDFSNDKSVQIVKSFSDPRINIIELKKNKGVYFCRNLGIRISNSKYLAFIDSDDYWDKDKLRKQINFMQKFNHKFTYTDYIPFKEINKQKLFKKKINVKGKFNLEEFINNSSIAMSTVIVERSLIKNLKFKKLKICEDYLFKCEILKKQNAYKCEDVVMFYRISKNSLQSNKLRNIYWVWFINRKYNKLNFLKNIISLFSISINSIRKYGFK